MNCGLCMCCDYLEILTQLIDLSPVLTPDLFAPGAAVGRVVAHVDTRCRERGALSARTGGALRGALTLGTVIRVQEIPFPHVIYAAIGFAGAVLLPCHREAHTSLCAEEKYQTHRAYSALHGEALIEEMCHSVSWPKWKVDKKVGWSGS